jgi:hypothetical protein
MLQIHVKGEIIKGALIFRRYKTIGYLGMDD